MLGLEGWARQGQDLLCLLSAAPLRGCRPLAVRVGNEPSGFTVFWLDGSKASCSLISLSPAHIAGTVN